MVINHYHGNTGQIRTQFTFIAYNLLNFLTYTFICRENNQWMSRIHSCLKSIPGCMSCRWSLQDVLPTCLVFVSDCNQINITKTAKLFQISSCWKHLPKMRNLSLLQRFRCVDLSLPGSPRCFTIRSETGTVLVASELAITEFDPQTEEVFLE